MKTHATTTTMPRPIPIGTGKDVARAFKQREYFGPPSFPRRRKLRLDGKGGKGEVQP